MAETRYILKILSGLHAGAEFCLPPGVTRLGKSPDCDLVLHDQGIDAEHIILRCAAEEALVECPTRESAALLDGREQLQRNGPYTISDYGLVSSAGLYLALGREGTDWDIPTPDRLFAQFIDSRTTQQQAADNAGSDDNADSVVRGGEDEPHAEAEEAAIGAEEATVEGGETIPGDEEKADITDPPGAGREAPPWRRLPRRARVAGGAALAVALLCAVLLHWHGKEQQAVETPGGPVITRAEIETIAARFRIEASYELTGDNVLQARGYALNNEEKHGFIRAMYARGIIVKPRLVITEDFRNNILNILEQLVNPARHESISVAVKPGDIKTLVLRGYVQDAEKWRAALAETVQQVDVMAYEDEVTHWDDGFRHLLELLERHGLGAALRLEQDRRNDRVALFVKDRNKVHDDRLESLVEEYRKDYSRPELLVSGRDGENTMNMPEFTANKVLGASFNVLNYLLLDDGQRYFVGSFTPDGYRVDEINDAFAVFSLDDTDYVYYFDEPDPPRVNADG
ncbi:MAG: type III secretion system inner membrane ring subunit SctD [Gammaproteobacteria bacterium]|nr:type III secretion system inner membrane ring subunit SctD [Gammaproteobacteria bacterium]